MQGLLEFYLQSLSVYFYSIIGFQIVAIQISQSQIDPNSQSELELLFENTPELLQQSIYF